MIDKHIERICPGSRDLVMFRSLNTGGRAIIDVSQIVALHETKWEGQSAVSVCTTSMGGNFVFAGSIEEISKVIGWDYD